MRHIFFIAIFALVLSCKKSRTVEAPPDLGYDYFPVTLGKYVVYDVDSTIYNPLSGTVLYAKYRIKEVIDSTFKDNQGRETFRLSRYYKNYNATIPYNLMSWTYKDAWMLNKTPTTAEEVEENIRYIKLTFPVVKNNKWNGNAQNTIGDWQYKYTEVDKTESIGGFSFEKTLTVIQKHDAPAIYYQHYEEKYAKGIGMIYKEISDYKYKIVNGILYPGQISEGIIYKMKIVDYHL